MGWLDILYGKQHLYKAFAIDADAIFKVAENRTDPFFGEILFVSLYYDFPALAALGNYLAGTGPTPSPKSEIHSEQARQKFAVNLLQDFGHVIRNATFAGVHTPIAPYEHELEIIYGVKNPADLTEWENANKKTNNILIYEENDSWFVRAKKDGKFVSLPADATLLGTLNLENLQPHLNALSQKVGGKILHIIPDRTKPEVDEWQQSSQATGALLCRYKGGAWRIALNAGTDETSPILVTGSPDEQARKDLNSELKKLSKLERSLPIIESFLLAQGLDQYKRTSIETVFTNLAQLVRQGFFARAYEDLLAIKFPWTDGVAKNTLELIKALLNPNIKSEAARVVELNSLLDSLKKDVNRQLGRDMAGNRFIVIRPNQEPQEISLDKESSDPTSNLVRLEQLKSTLKEEQLGLRLLPAETIALTHLLSQATGIGLFSNAITLRLTQAAKSKGLLTTALAEYYNETAGKLNIDASPLNLPISLEFDEENHLKAARIKCPVYLLPSDPTKDKLLVGHFGLTYFPKANHAKVESVSQLPAAELPGNQGKLDFVWEYEAENSWGYLSLDRHVPVYDELYANSVKSFFQYVANNPKKLILGGTLGGGALVLAPFLWPAYTGIVVGLLVFEAVVAISAGAGASFGAGITAGLHKIKNWFGTRKKPQESEIDLERVALLKAPPVDTVVTSTFGEIYKSSEILELIEVIKIIYAARPDYDKHAWEAYEKRLKETKSHIGLRRELRELLGQISEPKALIKIYQDLKDRITASSAQESAARTALQNLLESKEKATPQQVTEARKVLQQAKKATQSAKNQLIFFTKHVVYELEVKGSDEAKTPQLLRLAEAFTPIPKGELIQIIVAIAVEYAGDCPNAPEIRPYLPATGKQKATASSAAPPAFVGKSISELQKILKGQLLLISRLIGEAVEAAGATAEEKGHIERLKATGSDFSAKEDDINRRVQKTKLNQEKIHAHRLKQALDTISSSSARTDSIRHMRTIAANSSMPAKLMQLIEDPKLAKWVSEISATTTAPDYERRGVNSSNTVAATVVTPTSTEEATTGLSVTVT